MMSHEDDSLEAEQEAAVMLSLENPKHIDWYSCQGCILFQLRRQE